MYCIISGQLGSVVLPITVVYGTGLRKSFLENMSSDCCSFWLRAQIVATIIVIISWSEIRNIPASQTLYSCQKIWHNFCKGNVEEKKTQPFWGLSITHTFFNGLAHLWSVGGLRCVIHVLLILIPSKDAGFELVKQLICKNLLAQHGKRPAASKKIFWVCKSFYEKYKEF